MPFHVPELKRKLEVLYRHNASICSHQALADALDPPVNERTVRNWANGAGTSGSDSVPDKRRAELVEIFRTHLPRGRTAQEVEALLGHGTAHQLQAAFLDTSLGGQWVRVVLDTLPLGVQLVSLQQQEGVRLTEPIRAQDDFDEARKHPVGQPFMFRLDNPGAGWVAGLQSDPGGFHAVFLEERHVVARVGPGPVQLPDERTPLRESIACRRRYLFLCSPVPLPEESKDAMRASFQTGSPVESAARERLAEFQKATAGSRWLALDVRFDLPAL